MQLNFFPFFSLAGSVTRPRVSYIEEDSSPLSTVPSYCCSAPEIRTVYSRPAEEESREKLVFILCLYSQYSYHAGFRPVGRLISWRHLPMFFDHL